ncbi:PREDICTED: histone H1-delta-like [Priapulus caudatus]|uniref:Histone H1-delta-like n=1 Tax=Priapulus caudatus TaxID=37621 RepID=A0ABM1ELV4_PRICU|nr:PREDICTED: histone H1-delta-like [Priapulus caudatus]
MADTGETAAAVAQSPKKKAVAKTKKAKAPASHPKYSEMVQSAITSLKERGGSSRQAIMKYIKAHYKVGNDDKIINAHLKMCLKRGVTSGQLKQVKGTGASGSFRLGEQTAEKTPKTKAKPAAKKAAAKPRKPAVISKKTTEKPKAKTAAAKKPKTAKKPIQAIAKKAAKSTKKSPAKKAAKPKTVKKAATKKTPKKAKPAKKSPKKAAK